MIVIIMGVVGSGKTTVGKLLSSQLGYEFRDADDFHPNSNVEKIRHGIALTDEDREPWLESLREAIVGWIAAGNNVVLACSALKRAYRTKLCAGPQVHFVYLKGSAALIAKATANLQAFFDPLRFPYGPVYVDGVLQTRFISLSDIVGQIEAAGPRSISL